MPGICLECRLNPPPYDKVFSVCRFEGLIQEVILKFKYRRLTIFKKFLAELIFSMLSQREISSDILTFVPLHWSRMIRRGYNQSALIARELSGYMGIGVRYGILHKTRNTPSQVGLKKKEREQNLKSSFSASGVEGKSVMVVDDVITTGQTAREVSKALKQAGASEVIFVSVGRTIT
jgi:ComF family protein